MLEIWGFSRILWICKKICFSITWYKKILLWFTFSNFFHWFVDAGVNINIRYKNFEKSNLNTIFFILLWIHCVFSWNHSFSGNSQISPTWILILLQKPLSETSKSHRPYLWSRSKCWMRAHKRTFNAQRLKSQIWTMGFRCFVSFANSTNQNYLEYYLYQEHIQDCSSRNTEQCILFPFM